MFLRIYATLRWPFEWGKNGMGDKQNSTFTTKPVFCCYTCDALVIEQWKVRFLRVINVVLDENETTLYFFVD
jgi:hypothetical protein